MQEPTQEEINKNIRLTNKTKQKTGELVWQIVELTDALEIAMIKINELENIIKGGSIAEDKPK